MIRSALATLAASVLLYGCDTFYGPIVTNAYRTDVDLIITYATGEMSRVIWPACSTGFVGRSDTTVESLSIEKNGRQLRLISADEVRSMLEKEKNQPGSHAWNVGPNRVSLSTSQEDSPCPRQ